MCGPVWIFTEEIYLKVSRSNRCRSESFVVNDLCTECSVDACLCEASLVRSSYGRGVVPQIHKIKPTIWTIRECVSERTVGRSVEPGSNIAASRQHNSLPRQGYFRGDMGSETSRKYRCSRRQLCWPEVMFQWNRKGGVEVGREVARLALKEKRR